MKYLVTLTLRIGEYEKTAHHVVTSAKTKEEAQVLALEGECHGEPDFSEFPDKDQVWDMHEMIYTVYSIKEITDEQYAVLKEVGITY